MSDDSQTTDGPWFVGDLDHNGQRIVRQAHIEIATCWHHCVGSIEKEMEANARLIAAAPDLLAACKGMLEWTETRTKTHPFDAWDAAKNAVAKAEGISDV